MNPILKLNLLLYFLLYHHHAEIKVSSPKVFTARVIKIVDGDTFDALTPGNEKIRIRMNGIDCPEKKQDYFQVCKNALSTFIAGKTVGIVSTGKDRYRRLLANVYLENTNVNLLMIQKGYAWHYKKYSKDPQMEKAEIAARREKIGLWKNGNAIPPWSFRQSKRVKLSH